jgi:hypothetical protein
LWGVVCIQLNTLAITCDDTSEGLLMIRCAPWDGRLIVDFAHLALIDLAVFQSGIYLHLGKHEATHSVLTIGFFESKIHLTALQTEYLSRLLDPVLCPGEQLVAGEVNQDTSDRCADCESDCVGAATRRICNFGQDGHCCFVDTDDDLLCGTTIDACGGDFVFWTCPTLAETQNAES